MKIPKLKLCAFFAVLLNASFANAAIVDIADGASTNLSAVPADDTVNFLGNTGTLAIDTSRQISGVTATTDQKGTINFGTAGTLTSTGNIGTLTNSISNIVFNSAGTLDAKGSIFTNSGITTATNNQGSLTLSGTIAQTISSTIGSSTFRLNTVTISQGSGVATTLSGDVFANNLVTNNAGGATLITIDGAGKLDFNNSTFNQDTAISNTDTINLGATTLADTKTLTLNSSATLSTLTFGTSGNLVIANVNTATITGDILGTGVIKGDANNAGDVLLSGSAAQSINSRLGTNSASKLGGLTFNNTNGAITLNKDSDINILTATLATALTNNGILNSSAFNVNETTSVGGTGTNSFGATTLANAKTLTLNSSAALSTLTFGTSGNLVIASGKTATITGDVLGTGVIKGAANNVGDVLLSGSAAQSVDATVQLGDVSNRLNKIGISNIAGVSLNNDVFTNNFDFSNATGTATATIATTKTINITGNITQTGAGTSVIDGLGTVSMSGTAAQSINSKLGLVGSRLSNLIINNAAGATFNQNAFLTALTQTSGALGIAGGKTIDVTNAVNLSGKTLNIGVGNAGGLFGKIKSAGAITVDGTTTINFDYSNNSLAVNGGFADIAESSGAIAGIAGIIVTDNSFLFQNTLSQNGNNIRATISADTTNFNINTLGADNFELLNNALSFTTNSKLATGIVSVTSQQQLISGLKTLKPVANGSIATTSMAMNDDLMNVVNLHTQKINSNIAGFNIDNKKSQNGEAKIWGQVFGNMLKQNSIKEIDGYDANIGGLAFGSDHIFKGQNNVILGGALAYSGASIEHKVQDGNAGGANNEDIVDKNTINSYQIILYNNNSSKSGLGFYNNNIVNVAYNQYNSTRNIIIGSTNEIAKASYNGYSYGAKSDVGYNFKLSDQFLFAPSVGLKYFSLTQSDYQETGAGNDGLKVTNKNFNSAFSEVGFNLTSRFKNDYFNFVPRVRTSWEHSLGNNTQRSTVTFIGGGSEMQNDSDLRKDKFNFGLGLNITDDQSASSVQLEYNLQLAEKFISNSASVQYRYIF